MTDIAGRLAGVTVLVLTRPFLSGYVCAVLAEAEAWAVTTGPGDCDVAALAEVSRPLVACVEADLDGLDVLLPALEAHRIPCLMVFRASQREGPAKQWAGPVLRQPFAGFQIIDALQNLLKTEA